ncbi:sigma-54-dependent Fis family transcriptional regulator [Phaeobacter inhibens]|uniref:sigma-54-dependent Fis family transcriptional regulator n=1 Tax=Phaeobacter inhibens TaxID=221822 RepID=UPI002745E8D7|nr:sigma-54-dependent Fis family transcriptional regulator [Phaeobacter inhibens]GLO72849.1 sigma-54-dependent Fis family transcriptional regulator [Phaeobacter inhibens]
MKQTVAFEQHVQEIIDAADGKTTARDPEVIRSWLRCINDYDLDPEHKGEARILPEAKLREHQQESEDLLSIARFGMEDLYRRVNSMGYVLLLTDAKGVTVDFIGDEKVDRELKRAGLYIGSEWSEANAGTCGVGACLTTGEALTIHQTDHFDMAHTPLSCTAAPIYHSEGSLIGVLDVSLLMSPSEKYSQALTLEVVKSCVRRIELANLMNSRKSDWILRLNTTSEFLGVDPNCAVSVASDGTISGLTHGAHRLFSKTLGQDWKNRQGFIGKPFEDVFDFDFNDIPRLLGAETPGEQALEMSDGQIMFADVRAPRKPESVASKPVMPDALKRIHGGDSKMLVLAGKAARIVDKHISIILEGETGVGKEFVAKALHEARKKKGPFVAINCAALPEALIESELFGYAPNSFTGANAKGKKGLIEQANGGTLFLDEIGDMPLALQARLLRVLAEKEVMAVGATKPIPVDVRVVSASHRNLKALVDAGQFRQDLFYRLNGVVLQIPALREREDKPWVIEQAASIVNPDTRLRFSKDAHDALLGYDWPGNVRELITVLEVCLALCDGNTVELTDLPEQLTG